MTADSSLNPPKTRIIQKGFLEDKREFARDTSLHFIELCDACRRGDLEAVQTLVSNFGVDVNRTDEFDASPLMLASLCGHADVVRFLLNAGAILDRHSFQGERCLYASLNDDIRMTLLKFDVSKAVDPTQPFASFLLSLLNPVDMPSTADIIFKFDTTEQSQRSAIALHKFILAARSPDFRRNLSTRWKGKRAVKLASIVHPRSFDTVVRYLYSGEVVDPGREHRENMQLVAESLHLPSEVMELVNAAGLLPTLEIRELKRNEMSRVQKDFEEFVQREIIERQRTVNCGLLEETRKEMSKENPCWADCLVYIDRQDGTTTFYYAHIAILTRAEYFLTMFTSAFSESKTLFEAHNELPLLQLSIDADVAPIVLSFLYTDRVEIPRDIALDVLFAADFLFLTKLKSLAAIALENEADPLNELTREDLYEVLRAAWTTDTPRLDQFVAKNLAKDLDFILTDPNFHQLVKESANRISERQETDTIELIDDIRFYLGQWYGISQEDIDPTGRINESERPTTTYEREYNQKLILIDGLLEQLDLDA